MFQEIHFANPAAAYYFVLGFIFIALFALSLTMRKKALVNFAESQSLQKLLFLEKRTVVRYLILTVVWFLAVLALMQPQKIERKDFSSESQKETLSENLIDNTDLEKIRIKRRACDVIFLVDASASMQTLDTRMKSSRLSYAKEIVDEIMSGLDGQNVALYAFTSELTPLVPPTLDYLFTRLMARNIQVNEGDSAGTDLLEALELIGKKHFATASQKENVLILLSDGGDTYLESLQGDERKNQTALLVDKVRKFQDKNIKVFTIGLGTEGGAKIPDIEYENKPVYSTLDSNLLSELSRVGHGRYFFANDYSAPRISESILNMLKESQVYIEEEITPEKKLQRSVLEKTPQNEEIIHYYQYPLILALLLFAGELLMTSIPIRKQVVLDE